MPRVSIKAEEYAMTDFRRWLVGELKIQGITQNDIAGWIGVEQSAVSRKIKNCTFKLDELMKIFKHLNTSEEQIGKLLSIRG